MKLPNGIAWIVLIAGLGVAATLWGERPEAPSAPSERPLEMIPTVRVLTVEPRRITLSVHSRGTVRPRTRTALAAQVSGGVSAVAPQFHSGGFFQAGEVMLEIEAHEFTARLARAQAQAAASRLALAEERALAEQARRDWPELSSSQAPPLALREPQLSSARANLRAAEAEVFEASRQLEKTQVRAPFAAMVQRTAVAPGQYAATGSLLAEIFAVDSAEVRLPVEERELAYLDLNAFGTGDQLTVPVRLHGRLAGARVEWQGRIVRSEGVFDDRTHTIFLVAEVPDPYALEGRLGHAPMPMGLFVEAEIAGRSIDAVMELPAHTLRAQALWIVDSADRLRRRNVGVLKSDAQRVLIVEGLAAGERVCLTPLEYPIEGMRVLPEQDQGAALTGGRTGESS
jgi:RND family efflux transporter MFP subunit